MLYIVLGVVGWLGLFLVIRWLQYRCHTRLSTLACAANRLAAPMTGRQLAQRLLVRKGLAKTVRVPMGPFEENAFYLRDNIIKLDDTAVDRRTVLAVTVASHEVGHAIRWNEKWWPMRIKHALTATFREVTMLCCGYLIGFAIGAILGYPMRWVYYPLMAWPLLHYAAMCFFGLWVEYDASKLGFELISKRESAFDNLDVYITPRRDRRPLRNYMYSAYDFELARMVSRECFLSYVFVYLTPWVRWVEKLLDEIFTIRLGIRKWLNRKFLQRTVGKCVAQIPGIVKSMDEMQASLQKQQATETLEISG